MKLLDQARQQLARRPELHGARLIRELAAGPVSCKWLCARGAEHYVLSIDRPLAARLGIDREAEYGLLKRLAAHALVSSPVAADVGVLVTRYQPGRVWTRTELTNPDRLGQLASALRRLHAAPVSAPPLRLASRLARYAELSGQPGAEAECCRAQELLDGLCPSSDVVCHNDPVVGNIVGSATAMLIDWEYAGAGDRHFDLAAVLEHHRLSPRAERAFVLHYGKSGDVDVALLRRWREIYRLTASLWKRAVARE